MPCLTTRSLCSDDPSMSPLLPDANKIKDKIKEYPCLTLADLHIYILVLKCLRVLRHLLQ